MGTLIRSLSVVYLWLTLLTVAAYCRADHLDAGEILDKIVGAKGDLQGYEISATETSVTFPRILNQATEPSDGNNQRDAAPAMTSNTLAYVYVVGVDQTLITSRESGSEGDRPVRRSTLISSNTILSLTSGGRLNGQDLMDRGRASARKDRANTPGLPLFLSASTLGNWIRASSNVTCTLVNSNDHQSFYIFEVPANPNESVALSYQVYFDATSLKPTELRSYLSKGELYSVSALTFGDDGDLLCRKAITSFFVKQQEWRKKEWRLVNVARQQPNITLSEASFFPSNTYVVDERYPKASYTMGSRPPTTAELIHMTNNLVRRNYEVAAHGHMAAKPQVATREFRVIFFALVVGLPAAIWIGVILGKGRK